MEILNLLVGIELIIVGIIYLLNYDITSAASWSIFGCMYIVMDKYTPAENLSHKRKMVDRWNNYLIYNKFFLFKKKVFKEEIYKGD